MKELTINLAISELNTVLEALGNLPYARVYELVSQIHGQAKEQLNGPAPVAGILQEQEGNAVAARKTELHAN